MKAIQCLPLLLLSFSFYPLAHAAPPMPAGLTQECKDYIKSMPAELEYDWIQVPEDWEHPKTSPKTNVFYYMPGLHSLATSNITPIIYFNGGPDAPSHHIYEYFRDYTPASKGVPFLYVDQRGTGCSGSLPKVPVTYEGAQTIARYGSRNIVLDAEAIRLHLFPNGKKWKTFGQSFGGYIVQRYLQIAPYALEKAFAHGASLMTDGIAWGVDRLLAQKRNGELYDKLYPGDKDILNRARSQFPANYCTGNETAFFCGAGLLDYLGWEMLGFSGGWKSLHESIVKLLDSSGNLNFHQELFTDILPNRIESYDSMDDFLIAVVPGREVPAGALNTWSCKRAVARLIAQGEDPLHWEFNECRQELNSFAKYDSFIESMVEEDYISIKGVKRSLKKNPSLEFYLYSGGLDAIVPVESFQEEVATLGSRIHYTNFPKTGHNWMSENQIWDDLKR